MKNYMIKLSFVSPEEPKARANKTGINFMNFHLIIRIKFSVIQCHTWFFSLLQNRF